MKNIPSPKTAFLMKSHTYRSYKELAVAAKSFSVSLYNTLQSWSEHDNKHLELLYKSAFEDNSPDFAQPYPFVLEYEEDPSEIEKCMQVIEFIGEQMRDCEAQIAHMFQSMSYDYLAEISQHRVNIAQKLMIQAKNFGIFNKLQEVTWQCSSCGIVTVSLSAPSICEFCEAPYNAHTVYIRIQL